MTNNRIPFSFVLFKKPNSKVCGYVMSLKATCNATVLDHEAIYLKAIGFITWSLAVFFRTQGFEDNSLIQVVFNILIYIVIF